MLSELRRSFGSVLYERTSSPLYGAFLLSWIIWNWKVPYITFFIDQSEIGETKINWLIVNCSDLSTLFLYPLISTVLFLTIVPFAANGFYWLHVKFNKWKIDQKNQIEMKSLLTLEQSIKLREEIVNSEKVFETMLEGKDSEISQLKAQMDSLVKVHENVDASPEKNDSIQSISMSDSNITTVSEIVEKITSNNEIRSTFKKAVEYIQGGYSGLLQADNISLNAVAYLEVNHLITHNVDGTYVLTDFGKEVLKNVLNEAFV